MATKAQAKTEAKPDAGKPEGESAVQTRYTAEQLAKFSEAATEGLADFEATVHVTEAAPVELTETDRAFVRKAAEATAKLPVGGWLHSKIPTDIPREVAAKILAARYNVIYAAAVEAGFKPRRQGADKNSHVLVFRVNKPAPKDAPQAAK